MLVNRERLSEIVAATVEALARRGRLLVLGSCALVLVASWWGAQRFADHLLTSIPAHTGPESPTPLTAEEMQAQVRQAQELNAKIREQREAARAYSAGETDGLAGAGGDPDSVLAPIDWNAPGSAGRSGPVAPGGTTVDADVDIPATPLFAPRAQRSTLARDSGVTGTVVVRAHVGSDGRVLDTSLERSIPMLNAAAVDAVRRIRFRPAERNGRPVESWVSVPVTIAD